MNLRPSPRVRPRVYLRAPGCLLVWEPDCGVGGGGFAIDGASVAVLDGEAVVCGSPTVDAGVEVDWRGVVGCGGVDGDDGGFASVSPRVAGGVRACGAVLPCDGGVFCHGLCLARIGGLFAGVLDACAGDPRVGDGADVVAVREGDGGGVAASFVGAWLVVERCVYGDDVCVSRVGGPFLARVLVVAVAATLTSVLAWCEGEYAVVCAGDGFTCEHVGECLLFAVHPFIDLALCERYTNGGEGLAPVARGGEGAGGDVRICCADGGGHGFALVEEDERHTRDGARVVGVGVEVCALDDASVCVCAHDAPVVCARVFARVAVCEDDGEASAVAQSDDVTVVAFHVAAVEELVEGGGELVCVAGGVLCGACWSKAVFDVVPRVHLCVFLSVASRLFLCTLVACCLPRAWTVHLARAFSCSSWYHGCYRGVKSTQTGKKTKNNERHSRGKEVCMSLLAVTVGADPSAVVDALHSVGWYGVNVYHRLACSGWCYDPLSSVAPVDTVDACCDTCGLRPVVESSLYAQPGMVDSDVSACVEEGDVLVFEGDPRASPVLFAVSRQMWAGVLVSSRDWREFVVAAGACGCKRRRVKVAIVAARELLRGGRA